MKLTGPSVFMQCKLRDGNVQRTYNSVFLRAPSQVGTTFRETGHDEHGSLAEYLGSYLRGVTSTCSSVLTVFMFIGLGILASY